MLQPAAKPFGGAAARIALRPSAMAKLYVHCGLHKTGTTALQAFLSSNRDTLARLGVYVPTAGRVSPQAGHHNLAWELTRDRRYGARHGNLADLARELAPIVGDVVISSEDFETLLPKPGAWAPLLAVAAETGRTLVPIVYVLHQAAYVESLYLQCLKAGVAEEFAAFAEEAVSRGAVSRREWVFQFDHARALEPLAALGPDAIVRNYHELVGGSTVADFLTVLGVPLSEFDAGQIHSRTHQRADLRQSLTLFYEARTGRASTLLEDRALGWMALNLPAPRVPPQMLTQFADAFRFSNEKVCRRFHLSAEGLVAPPPRPQALADLARVFSLETQGTVKRLSKLLPPEQEQGVLRVNDASRALHARWLDWVTNPAAPAPTP